MGALSVEERVKLLQALLPGIVLPSGAASAIGPAVGAWLAANGGDTAIPLATPSANGALSKFVRNSTIDFVTDCGADPTGATDCTAALNAAGVLLTSLATDTKLPKQSCRLFIPRGRYLVTGAPAGWDFTANGRSVEVFGCGDASIFELNCTPGTFPNIFTIQSSQRAHFHDLTFVGRRDDTNPDCGAIIVLAANRAIIERCRFLYIFGYNAGVQNLSGDFKMSEASFEACMVNTPTSGIVDTSLSASVELDRVLFFDGATLSGYSFPSGKIAYSSAPWWRHDNSNGIATGGMNKLLRAKACWFDEGAQRSIWIKGGPTANVPILQLVGCHLNPANTSTHAAATSCIRIENTDLVEIDGLIDSGFSASDVAALDLVSVGSAHIRGLKVNAAALSKYILADAGCSYVEIEDSNIADVDVRSSATRTVIKAGGIASDLVAANGTIAANALAKMDASGAVVLGTADGSALMMGPTRQAAAAAGKAALARPGQIVPLLNDNNAVITAGDQVIVSASVAGRIRTGTTAGKGVGVAIVGSAQAPDAITYVRVQPF